MFRVQIRGHVDGNAVLDAMVREGMEGVVAKAVSSPIGPAGAADIGSKRPTEGPDM
jgi:hypothetical protein